MKGLLLLILLFVLGFTSISQHVDSGKVVDSYGQFINTHFKAKVTSDTQLMNDVSEDKKYYNELKPPMRDVYGGLLNSKQKYRLKKTGFFRVQQLYNNRWVFVDPTGNAYFSLGVNGVGYTGDTYTRIKGRESIYEWLPEFTNDIKHVDYKYRPAFLNANNSDNFSFYVANRLKKNRSFSLDNFYDEAVYRLRKWGFNSEGGFSNSPDKTTLNFPQVRFANLPEQYRIPGSSLFDIYVPGIPNIINKTFKDQPIAAHAGNPLVIGYFFGNEIDYHQFKNIIPAKKASEVATKKVLVDFLENKYSSIASFNSAWGTSFADFRALNETSLMVTTKKAVDDMLDFFALYLDRFYTVIIGEFKKFDNNHLVLGDRYFTPIMNDSRLRDIICKVASKHLDVISYNYYTYGIDLDRLNNMYKISGKPIMLTEYHYGDPTQGQTSSIQMMDNEHQKGLAYRNYVENAAATGFVIGAHWFEYLDQAVTGRWFQGFNGEGFGIGLLNVADRPYKDFLSSVMKTNYSIYDLLLGKKTPYRYNFGPGRSGRDKTNSITIFRTDKPIIIDGIKDNYWPDGNTIVLNDQQRVTGIKQQNSNAVMSLAYDENYLYIFADVTDNSPMTNTQTGDGIWNGDAIELFIGPDNPDNGGPLQVNDRQVVLGASAQNKPLYYWYNNVLKQPEMPIVIRKHEDDKGYSIEAALPVHDLNIKEIYKAKKIRFDIGFNDGDNRQRNAQYMWNGVETNTQSRDKWGILVFN